MKFWPQFQVKKGWMGENDMCGRPYTQKSHTYIYVSFLQRISFGSAFANFETHFRPHAAIVCESV